MNARKQALAARSDELRAELSRNLKQAGRGYESSIKMLILSMKSALFLFNGKNGAARVRKSGR